MYCMSQYTLHSLWVYLYSVRLEANWPPVQTLESFICAVYSGRAAIVIRTSCTVPFRRVTPAVRLHFFSPSVVMWLWNPLPEIPGNPRASWDITKPTLFLCLCLFHWRLHYVSLSDFCRPGSCAAPSPWELKVISFSGWLTHIIAF